MEMITVKLKDISKPKQWKNLPIKDLKSKGYPVYGANGIIGYFDQYNHEYPTLAITCRGATCGNIHLTKPKSYITSNAMALDDLKIDEIDLNYLRLILKYRGFKDVITGAAQPQITRKNLEKIKLRIPKKLNDQMKIANLLTQVEILIAKREESIRLLDELLKSTFLDMFGDPIANPQKRQTVRFDDVVVLQRGFDLPKNQRNTEGTIPLYGSNGIVDYHDEAKLNGGIVTGRSGTIGKVYYSDEPFWPLNTTLFSKDLKDNNIIYLTYLLSLFRLERFHQGAGVPTLNRNNVHKEKIYKVDRDEQDKFATIVQQVEVTKAHYQNGLDKLNELFDSLSQRAFKGELDLSKMTHLKVVNAKALNVPSSSGATEIVIERQKVETIKGRAKSGAGELQENRELPVEQITDFVDKNNKPIYSKDFLWMILQQTDDEISYDNIKRKLEKYSFRDQPNYNQVQTDIFILIKEKKLVQNYDEKNKKIVLSK